MSRKEKKCKNPECEETIQFFDNPKKLYCNNTCKSRYHYLKDIEENEEIIWIEKALRLNYKIIQHFIGRGIYKIDADVIKALGFNRNVYVDIERKFCDGRGLKYFRRIKDAFFRYDIIEHSIILYY